MIRVDWVECKNLGKESLAIRLLILCCAVLKVLAHTESITLSRASWVSASMFTWEQKSHCVTVVRLLCFTVSLHQPPVVHQGWWTGCRCRWPWSWKEHPCSLHRPARTSGSPHCILIAGTPGRPEGHLREQIQFFLWVDDWTCS